MSPGMGGVAEGRGIPLAGFSHGASMAGGGNQGGGFWEGGLPAPLDLQPTLSGGGSRGGGGLKRPRSQTSEGGCEAAAHCQEVSSGGSDVRMLGAALNNAVAGNSPTSAPLQRQGSGGLQYGRGPIGLPRNYSPVGNKPNQQQVQPRSTQEGPQPPKPANSGGSEFKLEGKPSAEGKVNGIACFVCHTETLRQKHVAVEMEVVPLNPVTPTATDCPHHQSGVSGCV